MSLTVTNLFDVYDYNTSVTKWGKQRLAYQAVKEWNSLPMHTRNCSSKIFKTLFQYVIHFTIRQQENKNNVFFQTKKTK